ncbi:MAG: hypothetical protein ACRESU_03510 [Gammaproteobacteria bacterium]
MNLKRALITLTTTISLFFSALPLANADDAPNIPGQEVSKYYTVNSAISPLNAGLVGDSVDLNSGEISFREVDVSIPGNNDLPVEFARTFSTQMASAEAWRRDELGNWRIDVPKITTVLPRPDTYHPGWQPDRCTNMQDPGPVSATEDPGSPAMFESYDYWNGVMAHIPGKGTQELLQPIDANYPTLANTKLVTNNYWMVSCLNPDGGNDHAGNPGATLGEGFKVQTPDGLTYYFDRMKLESYQTISDPLVLKSLLLRDQYEMLASRVVDQYNNWVDYNYTPDSNGVDQLTSITSSDGREIDISYNDAYSEGAATVKSVTANGKIWRYVYSDPPENTNLSQVVLPNGDSWHFDLQQLAQEQMTVHGQLNCTDAPGAGGSGSATGSITHPLGATVSFTLQATYQGRADVEEDCYMTFNPDGTFAGQVAMSPLGYYTMAVTSKTISNPGGTGAAWSYTYSQTPGWSNNSSGADEKWVDVVGPDGGKVHYVFNISASKNETGTYAGWQEGNLDYTDYYLKASDPDYYRRVTEHPTQAPFIAGYTFQERRNGLRAKAVIRDGGQTLTQDSDTYNSLVETWDDYGNPLTTKEFNSIDPGRELDHTYTYENLVSSVWWLGQTASVTDSAPADGSIPAISAGSYSAIYNTSSTGDPTQPAGTIYSVTKFGKSLGTYKWTSEGELTQVMDAANNVTKLLNYYRGRPQEIDFPDGGVVTLVANSDGTIHSVTNTRNFTTTYSYDDLGRLTNIAYPTNDDQTSDDTSITPPTAGNLTEVTKTGTEIVTTTYDAMLRPIVTQRGTSYINRTFDGEGRTVFQSYPSAVSGSNAGTTTTYDGLGRVTQVASDQDTGQAIESIEYESGDKRVVTDPRGNVTTYTYDDLSGPDYSLLTEIDAPETETTAITRDGLGAMLSVKRTGDSAGVAVSATRNYNYNANRELCSVYDPETGLTVMDYNELGLIDWQATGVSGSPTDCDTASVPNSDKTAFTYDPMHRERTVDYPGTTDDITKCYDTEGNVTNLLTGSASLTPSWPACPTTGSTYWSNQYNGRNMPISESLAIDSLNFAVTPTYNSRAQLKSLEYPDLRTVPFSPDTFGRPTEVGSVLNDIIYYPNDAVNEYTDANGIVMDMAQNVEMLPAGLSYTGVNTWGYLYDPNGNITQVDYQGPTGAPNEERTNFAYDGLDRLTAMDAPGLWGASRFTYDALDNLRYKQYGSNEQNYNYDANNRLTTVTDNNNNTLYTLGYDAQGNETQRNSDSFVFDTANRMTGSSAGGSYIYDGNGRRIKTTASDGTVTYTIYDQSGQLLQEYLPAAGKTTDYLYLSGKLVAKIANQTSSPASAGSLSIASGDGLDGAYTLSWSSISGASSYTVAEQQSDGSWKSVYDGSALSTTISGKPGGAYNYRLIGCVSDGCGTSGPILSVGVAPTVPVLTVPSGVQNGSYTVSWTTPTDATSYDLQEYSNGAWSTIASGTSSNSITRPQVGGSYQYRARANNEYGTRGYTATSAVVVVSPPIPAKPTFDLNPTANGAYHVSWTPPAGTVDHYHLQESLNGGAWTTIYTGGTSPWPASGKSGGNYIYRVNACSTADDTACSSYSDNSVIEWVLSAPSKPAAPNFNVSYNISPNGSYTVSWTAPTGAVNRVRYTLEELPPGGSWTQKYTLGSGTSWSSSGRANGTYEYRVLSCNTDADNHAICSGYSSSASVYVANPPGAPTASVSPTPVSTGSSYQLSWTTPSGNIVEYQYESSNDASYTGANAVSAGLGHSAAFIPDYEPGAGYPLKIYNRARACNGTSAHPTASCGTWSGSAIETVFCGPHADAMKTTIAARTGGVVPEIQFCGG